MEENGGQGDRKAYVSAVTGTHARGAPFPPSQIRSILTVLRRTIWGIWGRRESGGRFSGASVTNLGSDQALRPLEHLEKLGNSE